MGVSSFLPQHLTLVLVGRALKLFIVQELNSKALTILHRVAGLNLPSAPKHGGSFEA